MGQMSANELTRFINIKYTQLRLDLYGANG